MWDLRARLWDSSPDVNADDELTSRNNGLAASRVEVPGEKDIPLGADEKGSDVDDNSSLAPSTQQGVADVQAITLTWTKVTLVLVLIFIYLLYAIDSLQSSMSFSFTPDVTSAFSSHSLTATTDVVAALVAGLARLPLAKILDVWGRIEGLALMMFFVTIGLIMMAATNSVEMYAAAQVFYQIGSTGIDLVLSVFVSDISSLKNRGLLFGLASTPYIYITWAAGPAVTAYKEGPGFRWYFGSFAIIQPVFIVPVLALFYANKKRAQKNGTLVARPKSGRTIFQSIIHYAIELDLAGLIMIIGGLALFLLPFSLYSRFEDQWRSPAIICMLVFGIVLLIIFGLYEKFIAPKSFLPIGLLFNRTVFGSCIYAAAAFISFYIWNSYFYSFLIVVNNLDDTRATYIRNIYSIVACFWAVIVGFYIKYSGRVKAPFLYFGVPFSILGVACMVAFRSADASVGFICMCQIFIAVGGGTTVICQQIIAMGATTHQNIATVLAIQYAFASVGGAIGSSIAAAVWAGVFPVRLVEYLPAESQADFATIYGSYTVQASYAVGSATRNAINMAYADAQRYMLIAAACFLGAGWFFVLICKDIQVKKNKQVKGTVF